MNNVLEFPSKIFVQWGAVAQEIVPYLTQRGAKREEIHAVINRLRTRWEPLESAASGRGTGLGYSDQPEAAEISGGPEESDVYASLHWRTQPARTLIESAMADYQRNARR